MHETMVAHGLLEAISAEAEKQNAKPIAAKISCGVFNAVNDEILCFAFETIAKGTICENLKLQIEHKPILAQCKNCNSTFEVELSAIYCSKCSSKDFELLPNDPLILEEIEFCNGET